MKLELEFAGDPGWVVMVSWLAGPGVTLMLFDVTETLPAVKLSFRVPVVPLIERSVKVATPLALVVALKVPPSVPPPDAIAAVTTMPATGLLDASFARIAG